MKIINDFHKKLLGNNICLTAVLLPLYNFLQSSCPRTFKGFVYEESKV